MAWQDSWTSDDDDESEGHIPSHSRSILREQLNVPDMQHQDVATAKQIHKETTSPDSRPPRPFVRRPRCFGYHNNNGVSPTEIFSVPKTQKSTSEIYWEEQLSDFDLEKFAKLSLL